MYCDMQEMLDAHEVGLDEVRPGLLEAPTPVHEGHLAGLVERVERIEGRVGPEHAVAATQGLGDGALEHQGARRFDALCYEACHAIGQRAFPLGGPPRLELFNEVSHFMGTNPMVWCHTGHSQLPRLTVLSSTTPMSK